MPCKTVTYPSADGPISAIVCSRGRRPKRCAYCSRPGGLLCDFQLASGKTCDLPMCQVCTHRPRAGTDLCRAHRAPAQEVTP